MKKRKLFLSLFILASLAYIFGIFIDNESLKMIFKPLIIIFLLFFYTAAVGSKNNLYILALLFSLIGDTLLLFTTEITFIMGLVSFLMTHILIMAILFKEFRLADPKHILISIVPFFILFFSLIDFLKDDLAQLFIPVVVYGIIISLFGVVALTNYLQNKSNRNLLILIGALLFISSDSILAINKFSMKASVFPVLVMLTYIVAQYFICSYMIREKVN